MARIRKIEIRNFRGIRCLDWMPSDGVNCLIGPGDSGKSTLLDAIDLCVGARRNPQFTDTDFYRLNVEEPILIAVTIGELEDSLKSIETYGLYLRSFNKTTGEIEDEPEAGLETVLTIQLTVGGDLDPSWILVSERAAALNQTRNLGWNDRVRIAPTRIGAIADYNLSWRQGSVLNRVSEERAAASAALAKIVRDARATFGNEAGEQLAGTLSTVTLVAKELGIPVGGNVKALLDIHSVSVGGGTISLHDQSGIPLRSLGIGSTRLLIAGLQRKAAVQSTVILVDELEYGLEPHRIIRLLDSLGAKEKEPLLQLFVTTHSPVALRELRGTQLYAMRRLEDRHVLRCVGIDDDIQGTIRLYPNAFLARSVFVCEGASEVGLIRGLDQHRIVNGGPSIAAQGVGLVDGTGTLLFKRAKSLQSLGYRTAVLRDDDAHLAPELEQEFSNDGGEVIAWRKGRALEDEIFISLSDGAVLKLIELAVELKGENVINDHIKSATDGKKDLLVCKCELTQENRSILAKAAKSKKSSWFKTVSTMEIVGRDIVGPDLEKSEEGFREVINRIFNWVDNAGE
ncbi:MULTISPECIES: ATP-dependent nuclease [Nitrosomonas]|uniref:Chromosome segregation protein SMC n=1 Tax=Nitrosomonas communis TaxID=44574 RepID=A0A0F7KGG4_9PROT|nr:MULTISPECIES: ATP-binding protein [Nitrosomonas]AKH38263.1 chromosome segregation protein SMC [Nitrosomonas communis]TYP89514.1 putative ATP-dependent endonuclease of OLD family [Nitrosomonas communis]UVS60246.1 AAA family ATPase [Nitrosomonas sp. PLL12]